MAVSKPAGLLVHPSKPGGPRTLWDGLKDLLEYELVNGGQISLINRLDRETSGIVLVCKNAVAASGCAKAMQQRRIRKEYLVIAKGWPESGEFLIEAPILRLGEVAPSRIWLKRAVHPAGAEAATKFRVLTRGHIKGIGRISLLRAWPLTGRTHQIRVHLSHAGYPVLGDKIYGESEDYYLRFIESGWTSELAEELHMPRHALHSEMLAFEWRDKTYEWRAPLPGDMEEVLAGVLDNVGSGS